MKVGFRVQAGFGYYFRPAKAYIQEETCDLVDGATAADLLNSLSFPEQMAMHIFINGRLAQRQSRLADGDKVFITMTTAGG